jgi:hypothetical protein
MPRRQEMKLARTRIAISLGTETLERSDLQRHANSGAA